MFHLAELLLWNVPPVIAMESTYHCQFSPRYHFYYRDGTFSTFTSFSYRDGKISTLISIYYRDGKFATLISFYYCDGKFSSLISFYYRDGKFSSLISFYYCDGKFSSLISFYCRDGKFSTLILLPWSNIFYTFTWSFYYRDHGAFFFLDINLLPWRNILFLDIILTPFKLHLHALKKSARHAKFLAPCLVYPCRDYLREVVSAPLKFWALVKHYIWDPCVYTSKIGSAVP